jgi:hypothetical protein
MRKFIPLFIFLLFVCSINSSKASHYASGHLTYQYVGDSTGIQGQYLIELILFRNTNGITFGTSNQNIDISINGQQSRFNLLYMPPPLNKKHPLDNNGWDIKVNYECGGPVTNLSKYVYKRTIVFNSNDTIVEFTAALPCCRDNSDNIVGGNLVLQSTLYRRHGENSLPKPLDEYFIAYLCPNKTFEIGAFGTDKDTTNDIIQLLPANSLRSNNSSTSIITIPFDSGFSRINPLPVDTAIGYLINPLKNTVRFRPTDPGVYTLSYKINNRRFDSTQQAYVLCGDFRFDIRVLVGPVCASTGLPMLEFTALNNTKEIVDSCAVESITIKGNQKFNPLSVDTTGRNFEIFSLAKGTIENPKKVNILGDSAIEIIYNNPVDTNDLLRISQVVGADSLGIETYCGDISTTNDFIYHVIRDCSRISLFEESYFDFAIYPNPAKGILNLKTSSDLAILSIFNLAGQELLQVQNPGAHINLESLSAGTYLLKAYTEKGERVVQKLAIE